MNKISLSPNFLAQAAHLMAGMAVIFGTVALAGKHALWYTFPMFVAYAALKEFWFDATYETPATAGDDLVDFLFYMGGAVIALLALAVRHFV